MNRVTEAQPDKIILLLEYSVLAMDHGDRPADDHCAFVAP